MSRENVTLKDEYNELMHDAVGIGLGCSLKDFAEAKDVHNWIKEIPKVSNPVFVHF